MIQTTWTDSNIHAIVELWRKRHYSWLFLFLSGTGAAVSVIENLHLMFSILSLAHSSRGPNVRCNKVKYKWTISASAWRQTVVWYSVQWRRVSVEAGKWANWVWWGLLWRQQKRDLTFSFRETDCLTCSTSVSLQSEHFAWRFFLETASNLCITSHSLLFISFPHRHENKGNSYYSFRRAHFHDLHK